MTEEELEAKRARQRAYSNAWYYRNKEQALAATRAWQAANKERTNAQVRARYAEEPEKFLVKFRKRRAERREQYNASSRRCYWKKPEERKRKWRAARAAEPEKHSARVKKWCQANPDKVNAHKNRRRARLRDARSPGVTAADWRSIKEVFGGSCAYCLRPLSRLERDHVEPISRGGLDAPDNVVPACKRCNCSKGNKTLLSWVNQCCA